MSKGVIWYVEIQTYRGFAPGAPHYMAELRAPGRKVKVGYADQADFRFDHEHEAIRAATIVFERIANCDVDLLLRGSYAAVMPGKSLAGSPKHRQVLDLLVGLADGIPENNRDMDQISHEWVTYARKHFVDEHLSGPDVESEELAGDLTLNTDLSHPSGQARPSC
jgi:hypothetical protein